MIESAASRIVQSPIVKGALELVNRVPFPFHRFPVTVYGHRMVAGTLDRFLANPLETVPGTDMTYAGMTNPRERGDLIAYLKYANATSYCRRQDRGRDAPPARVE